MDRVNNGKLSYLRILLFATALCTIYGCSNFSPAKKQSIKVVYSIPVTDPWLRKLTAVTKKVDIEASGQFKAGKYIVNGVTISVPEGTSFKINLSLPINDANVINTEYISGQLWTSQSIHSAGVLLPRLIVLENGKVSGEIDFVRTFATFLINILQEQLPTESDGGGIRALILNLSVKQAILNLRPNSVFEKDGKIFHIGDSSKIEFSNLVLDSAFNYSGDCKVDLKFLTGNKWLGKKVDCSFDGGNAHLSLRVVRNKDNLVFNVVPKVSQLIVLENSLYQFGKSKQSSALCRESVIKLREFGWRKYVNALESELQIVANLELTGTQLKVKTDRHQTIAYFPQAAPAKIQIDINPKRHEIQFQTLDTVLAQTAIIEILRPASTLRLLLHKARLSPISFDKAGNLNLALTKGTAQLQQLQWSNSKKYLRLNSSGTSELSIPKGMFLSLDRDSAVKMSLPLRIKMGSATMDGSTGELAFRAIDGSMVIDIDKEVVLQGNISFILKESSFLGAHEIAIKVQGLKIAPNKATASAHLAKCSLIIPSKDLQDVIRAQLPNEKNLDIDKTIFEKRHWRYRNAAIKSISLDKLTLENLIASANNAAKLAVSADVTMNGTIEKSSVMAIIKEPKKYQSKTWQIKAHCIGTGVVDFKFLPNKSLSKSELPYVLAINLPIPDDVHLDWSQVEDGLFHGLERGVILSTLKKMESVELVHKGVQALFSKNHTELDAIKLSNMVTKAVPGGMQADFMADATF